MPAAAQPSAGAVRVEQRVRAEYIHAGSAQTHQLPRTRKCFAERRPAPPLRTEHLLDLAGRGESEATPVWPTENQPRRQAQGNGRIANTNEVRDRGTRGTGQMVADLLDLVLTPAAEYRFSPGPVTGITTTPLPGLVLR